MAAKSGEDHPRPGAVCPLSGSQFERFGDSLGQVILGHRGVDLDGSQFETVRLRTEEFGEHPVTVEQVTQGPLRIAGLAGDLHSEPRLANAARRKPGVGRSQTA